MSEDPTKVQLDTSNNKDPRVRRMKGHAIHGHTPFDVPFISQITDNLWQGGCEDGMELPDFIDVVFSLYPWEKYKLNDNQVRYEYKLYDSEQQTFENIEDIANKVQIELDKGKKVLVHCQAGLNRSSLVAGLVLIKQGLSPERAINLLRTNRSPACLCNPTFERYLRSQ